MQSADEYSDGTVYLTCDPYPDHGPPRLVSGEEASTLNLDHCRFHASLTIGTTESAIQYPKNDYAVSLAKHISRARLSGIAAAIRSNKANSDIWPERIYIHKGDGPINEFLLDLDERTHLEIDDSRIFARVEERYPGRPKTSRVEYRDMLAKLARKYECQILDIEYHDICGYPIKEGVSEAELDELDDNGNWYDDEVHIVDIQLSAYDEDSAAGRLIACGQAIHDYLTAIRGGKFDARMIVELLRGGHVNLISGNSEGPHLEVKSTIYNINAPGHAGDRQKIELAQDISRFANGETNAILIMGYAEDRSNGISQVGQFVSVDLTKFDAAQYQSILDARIVPPVVGLTIEQVSTGGDSGVAFIYVPRQPEEMQPYLVQGAIVGEKIEGAFFSIVQRRGEASITTNASQIHGYIIAGKAFLRQQQN